jgi:hypothetical protein
MRYLYLLPLFLVLFFAFWAWNETTNSRRETSLILSSSSNYLSSSSMEAAFFTVDDVHRLLLLRTKQKNGVYLGKIEPAVDTLALELVAIFHEVMGDSFIPVITSANDYPYHARFSKHYYNKAIDFRSKDLNAKQKKELLEKAQLKIFKRGRVLLESSGKSNEHIHLELID